MTVFFTTRASDFVFGNLARSTRITGLAIVFIRSLAFFFCNCVANPNQQRVYIFLLCLYLLQNVWIKNGRSSILTKEFEEGNGFDVYIDEARFLPDSVTISKVGCKGLPLQQSLYRSLERTFTAD